METVPKAAAGEKTKWDEQRKSSARSHLGWFGWLRSVDFVRLTLPPLRLNVTAWERLFRAAS